MQCVRLVWMAGTDGRSAWNCAICCGYAAASDAGVQLAQFDVTCRATSKPSLANASDEASSMPGVPL